MQAITCGATPKNDVYDKNLVDLFLSSEKERFDSLIGQSALYQNKILMSSPGFNYLNTTTEGRTNEALRSLILKEFYECEKYFPYLGDIFLSLFFNKQSVRKIKSVTRFSKSQESILFDTVENDSAKDICKWFVNHSNIERTINVQEHEGVDIAVEFENNFSFSFEYDYDFYNGMIDVTFRDYRFIIIDGYIESIGEIHHLLTEAASNKEPYVIFCYGMSEDVKHNIMTNNRRGITKVLPVSLNTHDMNTLNILNDIAVIHDASVITSKMGQTISQETRKQLPVAKKITFFKNKIYIDPVCSDKKIMRHKKFLAERLSEAKRKSDVNLDPLKNRIKNFSMKRLNLFLPARIKNNQDFNRDLMYTIGFLKNINKSMFLIRMNDERQFLVPECYLKIAKEKAKSLHSILNSINIVIS
jgi:hypothetical protein